jgi:hypothetical protein
MGSALSGAAERRANSNSLGSCKRGVEITFTYERAGCVWWGEPRRHLPRRLRHVSVRPTKEAMSHRPAPSTSAQPASREATTRVA